jgi:transcriptional regulator with XRE-family HTH domain
VGGNQSEGRLGLGEFIRQQRRLADLSLRNLARLSGVSDSYLSQLERGLYRPSADVLRSLAVALGISPETLYTYSGLLEADNRPSAVSVEESIRLDDRLRDSQKQALLQIYRTMVED